MKAYIIPSGAYKPPTFFGDFSIIMIANLVPAMNEEEAVGRVLLDMKNKFPAKDGWVHLIGEIDGEDSTKEIKEFAEKL